MAAPAPGASATRNPPIAWRESPYSVTAATGRRGERGISGP